jgi:hypothetical protein
VEGALLQQVQDAAGCADDDLRAAGEGADLRPHGLAAKDEGGADAAAAAQRVDYLADLLGQLAGGHQHQRLDRFQLRIGPFDHRDGESQGFARTRLGLADNVTARQEQWQRLLLDGRRLGNLHGCERSARGSAQRERGK